jgi:hypothetical protein
MNARYSDKTGRAFAAVGPKRPEEGKEGKKNVCAPCSDKYVIADYSRRYEDRRSEVLLILECLWTLQELYETTE